jgi:hypothetical protein
MYIPVWLLFTVAVWTWLGASLCREEAYAAGGQRRAPNYRSCWGAASVVVAMFVGACVAILLVTPIAVRLAAGLVDVARRQIS